MWRIAPIIGIILAICTTTISAEESLIVFPGKEWTRKTPAERGVNTELLDRLEQQLGGRGCVVKDGYLIKTWGDQIQVSDWYSSAKPVLSTLLFFAIQEGLVKSVDQPIMDFGWNFQPKDKGITFRHLGSMSSGYARPESAGQAWAYNDFAIQLYQITLFDKVFKGDAKTVAEDPKRLGGLGLQDGLTFSKKRRLSASVRDFARIVWFWTNKGEWGEKQLLSRAFFDEYMKPQTPKDLPQSAKVETDDYLHIGSYGGDSNQRNCDGPGIYGFNWWFNDTGKTHPDTLTWPDAPSDTIMSLGAHGNSSAFIPSLNIVLVCADGNWGDTKTNEVLRLLTQACRPDLSHASYK